MSETDDEEDAIDEVINTEGVYYLKVGSSYFEAEIDSSFRATTKMRPTGIEYSNPFVVNYAYYSGPVPMPISVSVNGLASVVSSYMEDNARIVVKFVDKDNEVIDKEIKTDLRSGTNLGIYNSSKQAFAAVFGYTNPVGFSDGFTTIETYDKRIVRELKRQDLIIPKSLFRSKEREIEYEPNTKAIKDLEDLKKEIATLEKEIEDEPENAEFLKKPLGALLKRLMRLEAVIEANEARKTEIERDNELIRERNKELLKEQNAFKKKMKEEAKQKEKERLANIRKQDEEYRLERQRQANAAEERKLQQERINMIARQEIEEGKKREADQKKRIEDARIASIMSLTKKELVKRIKDLHSGEYKTSKDKLEKARQKLDKAKEKLKKDEETGGSNRFKIKNEIEKLKEKKDEAKDTFTLIEKDYKELRQIYKDRFSEGVAEEEETNITEGAGIIDNPELYEKAKAYADNIFKKPSAFKSGFIVKKYKELGGTYSGEKPSKTGIARWFKEEWKDFGNKEYPVFRPTKRITKDTPLTPEEIKPSNLKKQIALKQEIKGDANLPPFEEKTGGKVVALGVQAEKIPKQDEVWKWSNPEKVAEMARKYLGDMAVVFRSTKPKKKYMIFDPVNNKWVFFGEMGYEDFTKHQDPKRRENYLTRTKSMKGNWKDNRYSANNLSRNILW